MVLLVVAEETCEEQPLLFQSVIELEMQERIDCVSPIIRECMNTAQEEQWHTYNQPGHPREFLPSKKILMLIPSAS